jgi:hypothetical protein
LDFFVDQPLVAYGLYDGRPKDAYKLCYKKQIADGTRGHGSVLNSKQRKETQQGLRGNHKVAELSGVIKYQLVFEQNFSQHMSDEQSNKLWRNSQHCVNAAIQNAQKKNKACYVHKLAC